uniref:Uncharacterized protein n=1 Tax=Prymnesium polylepis TaxID=72548 RepID=A0A6V3YF55_9EUKA|mmetsp:Transcript_62984/g.172943  ORF Transcript_62984/g.172943 Transcript_62984/m.172943 type:complete len:183 (+) Transcript_62984:47-595(+)
MMSEILTVMSSKLQQGIVAITYMDPSARVEFFSLVSMACCLIGAENGPYMLSTNLAVALLGLICCRSGSELQVVALCVFSLFTTITDVVHMCTNPSGWGGLWSAINIVMKLGAATSASRSSATFRSLTGEDDTLYPPAEDEYQSYQRPLATDIDYQSMAAEAAQKHASSSSDPATSSAYRPI